jgi:hypothetical protein
MVTGILSATTDRQLQRKLLRGYGFEIVHNRPDSRDDIVSVAISLRKFFGYAWGNLDRNIFFGDFSSHYKFLAATEAQLEDIGDRAMLVKMAMRAEVNPHDVIETLKRLKMRCSSSIEQREFCARALLIAKELNRREEKVWLSRELEMYAALIEECEPR